MKLRLGIVVLASALWAGAAMAQPNFGFTVQTVGGNTWNAANDPNSWSATPNGNGWDVVGQKTTGTWQGNWNMFLDADPVVSNGFTLKNNTAVDQTYVVIVTLPIAPPVPAPTQLFGSVGLTLSDLDGVPAPTYATVSSALGDSIYTPIIDGVDYVPGKLLLDPFSFSVNAPFQVLSLPGPNNFNNPAGPNALVSIGIRNVFKLSAGDQVSIQSTFVVTPEPASMLLLALGGVLALRRR